ncbi:AAA family ATPase [Candidatus Bipolaricaulota sp. J31]
MRPLELEFQGLHSYRDPVEIDFARLTESGFFGIFGPTGSGKSTILDAITFALFGKVDRTSSLADSLTTGAEALWARFVFRLGDDVYEVYRRMERRGGGLVSADFYLSRNGTRLPLEGVVRLNRAVEELLGLSFEQFITAVFLPQGKFARFLRLKPAERRILLAEIFRLERLGEPLYRSVRERLRELEAEEEGLSRELSTLEEVTAEACAAAESEVQDLEGRIRSLSGELARMERKRRTAEEFLRLSTEREKLASRFAELLGQRWTEEASAEIEGRLRIGERARELAKAHEEKEGLARELGGMKARLSAARKELEDLRRKRAYLEGEAKRKLEALGVRERALREVKGKLSGIAPERVANLEERVRSLTVALEAASPGETLPFPADLLPEVEGILREALASVPRLDELSRRIAELEPEIAAARERLSQLAKALEECEKEHRELEAEVLRREEELVRLRRELAAAELARELVAGEPCPVCGSPHHPSPATLPREVDLPAMKKELEGLKGKLRAIREDISGKRSERTLLERLLAERERKLGELRGERARLEEELSGLRARLPESLRFIPWEELGERAQAWRARLERERIAHELEAAKAELARLDGMWREVVNGLGEIYEPLTREVLRKWMGKVEGELRRIEEERVRIEQNLEAFRTREGELSAMVSELGGRVVELERNLKSLERRVEEISRETGIPPAEAGELALDRAERERLEEALELSRRITQLLEDIAALEIADVREAEATLASYARAQKELGTLQHRLGEAKERLRTLRARLARKRELEAKAREVHARLKVQRELEGLLRGKAFLEYLVGNHFARILARASHYTAQLSQGRYVLQGQGTELSVIDYRNGGVTRSPHTLSGGETFLVSLSLALALSEAIQLGRRGGAPPIEFFFIDEGFGSLDEESVRMVLELLYRLVDEGLKVGVITHVEALRRGIPHKLLVHPPDDERGSRVELVIGE